MAAGSHAIWQRARIAAVDPAAESIARIELDLDQPVRPEPGSHVDIRIPTGEIRSYSIVRGSDDGHSIVLGVHLSPTSRGGSRFMHSLRPGDEIEVTAPLQNFPLRVGAPRYVLLAGGIGITAMIAMAAVLRRVRADYRFVYVGRTRKVMAFVPELTDIHGDQLEVHVDAEGTGLDVAQLLSDVDATTELYMCGPIRLMDAVRRAWLDLGLPVANLRYETFGNSGWFDAEEFVVQLPKLGIETVVTAEETLLEALEKVGVSPMYDCRKGECGLCQMDILDVKGAVDHRDVFFSEKQKTASKRICACVSRVATSAGTSNAERGLLVLDTP